MHISLYFYYSATGILVNFPWALRNSFGILSTYMKNKRTQHKKLRT